MACSFRTAHVAGYPVRASRPARASRRVGSVVAIVVNVVALYVVVNLLAWDWLPFLTDEFASMLPLLRLSLLATITVNVAYLWYDPPVFRSVMQIGLSAIAVEVVRFARAGVGGASAGQ